MFDITRRFTDDQRAALMRVVDDAYRQFVDRVSVGRKKPLEEVERLARGRVWTGTQALERGLIDELGGIEEAVAAVRRLARVPDGEVVDLVPLPARGSILDFLTGRRKSRPLLRGLPGLSDLQALLGLLDGKRPLALSPVRLIVN